MSLGAVGGFLWVPLKATEPQQTAHQKQRGFGASSELQPPVSSKKARKSQEQIGRKWAMSVEN